MMETDSWHLHYVFHLLEPLFLLLFCIPSLKSFFTFLLHLPTHSNPNLLSRKRKKTTATTTITAASRLSSNLTFHCSYPPLSVFSPSSFFPICSFIHFSFFCIWAIKNAAPSSTHYKRKRGEQGFFFFFFFWLRRRSFSGEMKGFRLETAWIGVSRVRSFDISAPSPRFAMDQY